MSLLAGLFVGGVLGLTGAGGGVLAVPLLMWVADWSLPQAVPVALAGACASAALGAGIAWNQVFIRYRAAVLMAIASLPTVVIGHWLLTKTSTEIMQPLFALLLAVIAGRVFFSANNSNSNSRNPPCRLNPQTGRLHWNLPCVLTVSGIGGISGLLAGMFGVGGGFVIVPALRATSELPLDTVVATSLLTVALISAFAIGSNLLSGQGLPVVVAVPYIFGTIVGMVAGRYVSPSIAAGVLQKLLACLMMVAALLLFNNKQI